MLSVFLYVFWQIRCTANGAQSVGFPLSVLSDSLRWMSHGTWEWSWTLISVIGWVLWFHTNKMVDPGIRNHWGSSLGEGIACPIQPNSRIDSPPSYPFYGQCWCHFLRIGCCRICSSLRDFRIFPVAGALWKLFSPPVFGRWHPSCCFPNSAERSTTTPPLLLSPVSTPHRNGMECHFIPWKWLLNEFYLFKTFLFYLMCSCWKTSTCFLMVKFKAFLLHLEGNLTCTSAAQVPLDLLIFDRNISSVILCLMNFCFA